MSALTTFLSEETVHQIGWVLVHFLWQGCAIAGLLWIVLKMLRKATSNSRYLTACAGLILMIAAPIITFAVLQEDVSPVPIVQSVAQPEPIRPAEPPVERTVIVMSQTQPAAPELSLLEQWTARLEAALPGCVAGWLLGVAALSLWYLGGWCQLQRLRRIGTKSVPEAVAEKTAALAQQLGIQRCDYIVESASLMKSYCTRSFIG